MDTRMACDETAVLFWVFLPDGPEIQPREDANDGRYCKGWEDCLTRRSGGITGGMGLTASELMGKDVERLETFFLMSGEDSDRGLERRERDERR